MDLEDVALLSWALTAAGGVLLATIWIARGGLRGAAGDAGMAASEGDAHADHTGRRRIPLEVIGSHALLAVTGLLLFAVYVGREDDPAGDLSLAPGLSVVWLLAVAVLGRIMYLRSKKARKERAPEAIAERRIPVLLALGHGGLAAATIVLVALVALD